MMRIGPNHPPARPSVPPGKRIYAIGEIHGEAQLLAEQLRVIGLDADRRGSADTTIIFLGNFIDRGIGAARLLMTFAKISDPNVVFLKGSHELALVDVYRRNYDALQFWLKVGGRATLAGFGIEIPEQGEVNVERLVHDLHTALEETIVEWLDELPTSITVGDYFFTQAGVCSKIPLEQLSEKDPLRIREPSLSTRSHHGNIVGHGRMIEPGAPLLGDNRIGINTCPHEPGELTALGLQDNKQWLLSVTDRQSQPDLRGIEASPTRVAGRWLMSGSGTATDLQQKIRSITAQRETDDVIGVPLPAVDDLDGPLSGPRSRRLRGFVVAAVLCLSLFLWVFANAPTPKPRTLAQLTTNGSTDISQNRGSKHSVFVMGAPISGSPTVKTRVSPTATPAASSLVRNDASGSVTHRRHTAKEAHLKHGGLKVRNRLVTSRRRVPPRSQPTWKDTPAQSPHLKGAALQRALARDVVMTRKANQRSLREIRRRSAKYH
jgi:serine/threonine protein phosphatase 1